MMYINECLTDDTPIFLTTGRNRFHISSTANEKDKLYIKFFNASEFIGEELCIFKNIRCSHYFLVGLGQDDYNIFVPYGEAKNHYYEIRLASKSFKQPKHTYKSVVQYGLYQFSKTLFEDMLLKANGEKNREELCNDMLQMLALDVYMGQTDRYAYNYLFEEDSEHNIRLAPLFDFQYSVNPLIVKEYDISYGDLKRLGTVDDCKKMIEKYPKFKEYLESYLTEDLLSVVKSAYAKRRMVVPEQYCEKYQAFDEMQKEKIKRIVF